jgi:hypothetical protein
MQNKLRKWKHVWAATQLTSLQRHVCSLLAGVSCSRKWAVLRPSKIFVYLDNCWCKNTFYHAWFLTKQNKCWIKTQYCPPKLTIKIILHAFHRYYAMFTSILDGPFFSFLILYTAGFLGRGISPRKATAYTQNNTNIDYTHTDVHA